MGCRCPQCYSLAELMLEETGQTYGLPPAPGHAPAPALEPACDGTYTCPCPRCNTDRGTRERGRATTALDRYAA